MQSSRSSILAQGYLWFFWAVLAKLAQIMLGTISVFQNIGILSNFLMPPDAACFMLFMAGITAVSSYDDGNAWFVRAKQLGIAGIIFSLPSFFTLMMPLQGQIFNIIITVSQIICVFLHIALAYALSRGSSILADRLRRPGMAMNFKRMWLWYIPAACYQFILIFITWMPVADMVIFFAVLALFVITMSFILYMASIIQRFYKFVKPLY